MTALLLAMASFALSMSISPGPVNMVIVASGAQHGIRRTLPFVSGATLGFTLLLVLVGFGLMQVFDALPWLLTWLGVAGALFILYVGYRIATAPPELSAAHISEPTFLQGALLQWLNPKAWIACAAGVSMFASPDSARPLLIFIGIYFVICYLSLAAWAVLGDRVASLLGTPRRVRLFNGLMGGLLMASALYLLWL
ncbi:LysE family translocator [Aquimonas sp.]|jgi:threonine/homoserine/homoserine lactone efflux protein|uniref:LysE family translocator n=1 Tax=Aquimonas sp. TaxID=1872588 RepID=UPI0037BEC541